MKAKSLREMSPSDLDHKLEGLKKELVDLRFKHAVNQLKNPIKLRDVRRDIARIYTIITEKNRSGGHGKIA